MHLIEGANASPKFFVFSNFPSDKQGTEIKRSFKYQKLREIIFFFLLEVIGKHGHSRRVQLVEVAVEYVKAVIAHFGSNYGIGIHSISRVVELLNMMAVSMTIMLMRRGVGQGRRSSRIGMLMVMVIHGFRSSSIGLFDCRPPFFLFSLLRFSASYYWSRVGVGWGSLDLLNGRGPSQLVFPVSFWTFNFTDGELYENEKKWIFLNLWLTSFDFCSSFRRLFAAKISKLLSLCKICNLYPAALL